MNLKDKMDLGAALFGKQAINTGASRATVTVKNNATSAGTVDVIMTDDEGNEQVVTVPCDGDLREGDTATLIIQDGVATAISANGSGTRAKEEIEAAAAAAVDAKNTAEQAAIDAQAAQKTAEEAAAAAGAAKEDAEKAAAAATAAETAAQTAATNAKTAQTAAETAEQAAKDAEQAAADAATATEKEAERAKAAEQEALDAATAAKTAADNAQSCANQALENAKAAADAVVTERDRAKAAESEAKQAASDAAADAQAAGASASQAQAAADAAKTAADGVKTEVSALEKYFYYDSLGAHVVSGDLTDHLRLDISNDNLSISNGGTIMSTFEDDKVTLNQGRYVISSDVDTTRGNVRVFNVEEYDWGTDYEGKQINYQLKLQMDYTDADGAAQYVTNIPLAAGIAAQTTSVFSNYVYIGMIDTTMISISADTCYVNSSTSDGAVYIGNTANYTSVKGATLDLNYQASGTTQIGGTGYTTLAGSTVNIYASTTASITSAKTITIYGESGCYIGYNNTTAAPVYIGHTGSATTIRGSYLYLNNAEGTTYLGNTSYSTNIKGNQIQINSNSGCSGNTFIGNQNGTTYMYSATTYINYTGGTTYLGNTSNGVYILGSTLKLNGSNGTTYIGNTGSYTYIYSKGMYINQSSGATYLGNTNDVMKLYGSTISINTTAGDNTVIGNTSGTLALYGSSVTVNGKDITSALTNTANGILENTLKVADADTGKSDYIDLLAYPINSIYACEDGTIDDPISLFDHETSWFDFGTIETSKGYAVHLWKRLS